MKGLSLVFCGLLLAAFPSATALADSYTYTYSGNDYTIFSNPALYTASENISGSFTVLAPLPASANLTFEPNSWSFSDGVQSTNSTNNYLPILDFSIVTNA